MVGCTVGALVGAVSGYFGGRIDNWIQRVVDIMLSFPIIVLAMVVVAVLGKQNVGGIDINLIVAIALPIVPKMARVARASTLSIVAMPFIDAARAAGFSHSRIVLRHILPNIVAPYLIMVTAFIAQAILLEASLSFLGLGVTEPTPAWGLMLSGGQRRLLPDRALDDPVPRPRHHARRVRLQPVRRQPARLARPEAEELTFWPRRRRRVQ